MNVLYLIEHTVNVLLTNLMQWFLLGGVIFIILSSDCHLPTDWPSGWLAGCEETNVCPFLIFFPLCIICRYLLDSQDQHVFLGGSALDGETWWIWIESWGTTEGICYLSTLWKGHRDLMNLQWFIVQREIRAQAEDINNASKKPVNVYENKYLLWSSICCFSGFFEWLPLTKLRSDEKIRTIFLAQTCLSYIKHAPKTVKNIHGGLKLNQKLN